jgi:hypothetical protein
MMLGYINQPDIASRIDCAWSFAMRENPDLKHASGSDLSSAILRALSLGANTCVNRYHPISSLPNRTPATTQPNRQLVGVEMTIAELTDFKDCFSLATRLQDATATHDLQLQLIGFHGFTIWPSKDNHILDDSDTVFVRFISKGLQKSTTPTVIYSLLKILNEQGFDIPSMRHLFVYDEHIGFSVL